MATGDVHISIHLPFGYACRLFRLELNFQTKAAGSDGLDSVSGCSGRQRFIRSCRLHGFPIGAIFVQQAPARRKLNGSVPRLLKPVDIDGRYLCRLCKIVLNPFAGPSLRKPVVEGAVRRWTRPALPGPQPASDRARRFPPSCAPDVVTLLSEARLGYGVGWTARSCSAIQTSIWPGPRFAHA